MIFEQLEANMMADVGRANANSVMNEIKALGIKFPKARPGLAKVFNQFVEVSRQLRTSEIMRPEALKLIRSALIPAAGDYINWAVNGDPEVTPGYEAPIVENDDLNPNEGTSVTDGSILTKFEATRNDLHKQLTRHHHVVAYAPVLPLCKPYLLREKLTERGVKYSAFEHYTILERQLVIGISNDFLRKKVLEYSQVNDAYQGLRSLGRGAQKYRVNLSGSASQLSEAAREKWLKYLAACTALRTETITVASQMKSDEAAQAILTAARELRPSRGADECHKIEEQAYMLALTLKTTVDTYDGPVTEKALLNSFVTSTGKALKKNLTAFGPPMVAVDATWMWVLTQKEINMLQSCALGGHFSLAHWGFSFTANE